MSIPVQCPACQHAFAVADRFAGKKGKCPKCGMIFKAEAKAAEVVETFPDLGLPETGPSVPTPKRLATMGSDSGSVPKPPPPPLDLSDSSADLQAFPTVPMGRAVSPTPTTAPASSGFAVSESGKHSFPKQATKSSSASSVLMLAAVGVAVALVAVIGIAAWSMSGNGEVTADKDKKSGETGATTESTSNAKPPEVKPPPPTGIDIAKLTPFKSRVFMLDIKSPQGPSKAACFLLDNKGYAATSYHAVAKASSVEAIGPAGIAIPVPGTSAIDAAHDLAIIKLEPTVPVSLEKFDLASEENPALGMSIASFDPASETLPVLVGKVKGSSTLAKLSPSTRSAIKRVDVAWADDTSVVQHDIRLPATLVGAPLVNSDGQVVALQVSASDVSGSLAVQAKHIAALLASAGSEIKPWTNTAIAATETPMPMTPEVKPPDVPMPMPEPTPPPPRSDDPVENLVLSLKEYHTECEKLNWKATDAREYARFQLLAKFLTQAAGGAETPNLPAAAKEKLEDAVRRVTLAIPADKFPDDKAWEETNKLAEKALETPGEGVFALGEVLFATNLNNEPAVIVQLTGTSQLVATFTKFEAAKLPVGSKVLIIGIHQPGEIIINNGERKSLFVVTKYVLLVEKEK